MKRWPTARCPPRSPCWPSTARFEYGQTGASYEVLGAVIEIASSQTLEAFMAGAIFEPLGLADSFFYVPEEKADRLPAIYRRVDGALVLDREYGARGRSDSCS